MAGTHRAHGVPCWAELDVDDPGVVTPFYAAVLGWSVDAEVVAGHQTRVLRHGGSPVAAIGSPGAAAPPVWTLYLAVDDVDVAAEQLEELGGQVLHGPEDDHAGGRLLVALDAGAAVVGLWESDDGIPAPSSGRLCWAEAASAEPGTTRTFYRELLGWEFVDGGDQPGHLHGLVDGGPVAGLGLAGDALPHWLPFFAAADVDAAVEAARRADGEVVTPVAPGPHGRHATLSDPAGARFGVIEVG
ncbi:VOC family protein [Actinomycetospora chibensis]|uniref:VOC family protein n=1 Tax=Actinomycetospora chibensis TaxID=663606 RepID=A0ABV9RJJ4_9PSEU|nr:VOC family protein [Actinomycetospora chibensis]MDD7925692.1 VOC family protein [Actinomycetospora chibensis]